MILAKPSPHAYFADGGNGTKYASKIAGKVAVEIRENGFMVSKAVERLGSRLVLKI
jgi:hypothetical protein